jgi:hypothetical protein
VKAVDIVRLAFGLWLYAHDVADEYFRLTIDDARHKAATGTRRTLPEEILSSAREGEEEIRALPSVLGLASRDDIDELARRLDRMLERLAETR